MNDSLQQKRPNYTVPLITITLLFFMWGFITCMNDILIPYLKKLFELSPDTQPYAYLFGEEDDNWFKKRERKTKKAKEEKRQSKETDEKVKKIMDKGEPQ